MEKGVKFGRKSARGRQNAVMGQGNKKGASSSIPGSALAAKSYICLDSKLYIGRFANELNQIVR
jgi:hypothetical protein